MEERILNFKGDEKNSSPYEAGSQSSTKAVASVSGSVDLKSLTVVGSPT